MDKDDAEKTMYVKAIRDQANFESRLGEFKDLAGPDYKLRRFRLSSFILSL